jgi:hypothetical protein
VRTTILILALTALATSAWAGGDSGYTPPNGSKPPMASVTPVQPAKPDYTDSCRKTLQMADDGLTKTSDANKAKAEQWIAKANASQSSGDFETCMNQAHQALTYEH